MTDLTAWYMQDAPAGFWVLRSSAGRLWAFPNVRNAWGRGLRFQIDWTPTSDPLPPTLARQTAYLLGVPGYDPLSDTELAMCADEVAYEWMCLPTIPSRPEYHDAPRQRVLRGWR